LGFDDVHAEQIGELVRWRIACRRLARAFPGDRRTTTPGAAARPWPRNPPRRPTPQCRGVRQSLWRAASSGRLGGKRSRRRGLFVQLRGRTNDRL